MGILTLWLEEFLAAKVVLAHTGREGTAQKEGDLEYNLTNVNIPTLHCSFLLAYMSLY